MLIPKYWAEHTVSYKSITRRRTLKLSRLGWSNLSQEEAEQHAKLRVQQAFSEKSQGQIVKHREPKVAYHGVDGIPIKEQIVAQHKDVIITRNSYGARCLNTPDVFFLDIDFDASANLAWRISYMVLTHFLFFSVMIYYALPLMTGLLLIMVWITTSLMLERFANRYAILQKVNQPLIFRKLHRWLKAHPTWGVNIYQTPAGIRLLVTHSTFHPNDKLVTQFAQTLCVDKKYLTMCLKQQCFRARLTAKPWRIGLQNHLKPSLTTWPIQDSQLVAQRQQWLDDYENVAKNYAACRFLQHVGCQDYDPKVLTVIKLHDELSGALLNKPCA